LNTLYTEILGSTDKEAYALWTGPLLSPKAVFLSPAAVLDLGKKHSFIHSVMLFPLLKFRV